MHTTTLADATITTESIGRDSESRQQYRYAITTASWQHTGTDIFSGVNAEPDEIEALTSLLSFLGACAESRAAGGGENSDLFPDAVGEWAEQNSDEIAIAASDLEN